jgi:hypothetical protein
MIPSMYRETDIYDPSSIPVGHFPPEFTRLQPSPVIRGESVNSQSSPGNISSNNESTSSGNNNTRHLMMTPVELHHLEQEIENLDCDIDAQRINTI